MVARGMSGAVSQNMLLTTESTAWAVTFSAGMTIGVILGYGVTLGAIASAAMIATIAIIVCTRLLRSLEA